MSRLFLVALAACFIANVSCKSAETAQVGSTSAPQGAPGGGMSPVSPDTLSIMQADGTFIGIIGYGNINESYTETVDGYTIVKDQEGMYAVAILAEDGSLTPSKITARNPEERSKSTRRKMERIPKHLRISGEARKKLERQLEHQQHKIEEYRNTKIDE